MERRSLLTMAANTATPSAKNGGTKGPDLSGVGRTLSKDQIRTQILQGGHEMPAFADILQKSEVDDLVAYLHSCRDKKPK